jgi:hypothetical protein
MKSGTPASNAVLTISDCGNIISNSTFQDRVYYATQTDLMCKPKACADGSAPTTCKIPQVCVAKAKWPKECATATKCDVSVCGGCAPIFLNDVGSRTCATCPDFATPTICRENPCDYSSKNSLQCANSASASFCLPSTCGGCKAQWYDTYGRPVCFSSSCSTTTVNFGKGAASLGFSVVNGLCKPVKGKKAPFPLFKDASQCTANCICVDNGLVDFGTCGQNLGFTLVMGACKSVQGCPERKTPLKMTFFDSLASCTTACPNPTAPIKQAASVAAIVTTATAATAVAAFQVQCPPGITQKACENPCLRARLPLCAEARGKDVICVADYCGNCTAKWLLNNQPFLCPSTQACTGSANCCTNTGTAPRDCTAFPCDVKTCGGATTCTVDPCRQCTPIFKDAQGREIPPSMCRGDINPSAFIKCESGDATCCKSGFRPLPCDIPPALLNNTCASLDCGNIVFKDRSCFADPCDSCSLQVRNARNLTITDQCQMTLPADVCTKVRCPAMTIPNCTARPPQCGDRNLVCIKDQCACQWRWYSVDMRAPSLECAAALQICWALTDCPTNYECDEIPAMQAQLSPEIAKQFICTQEICSCRPVLTPPVYGIRQPCGAADPNCCPDGLLKAQCSVQQAQWTCSQLTCDGATPDQCRPDGCNQCQLDVLDKAQQIISKGKCRLELDAQMKTACAKVQCPASSRTAACSPRPSCYPSDWALNCIVDPCSCRSLWVDQDIRSNIAPPCRNQIVAKCLTPEECPQNFECTDITPEIAARLDPQVKASLVCIQEPCTCRPISTSPNMLPPGFRLPCKGAKCCADGKGPLVCPAEITALACPTVQCQGVKISSCDSDGCNNCAIKLTGPNGTPIAPTLCRLPLNESSICPGTVCPPMNNAPNCGPRPSACPADWNLRCIRDPCVCSRSIWVDEDLRIAETACATAVEPPCATTCPTQFSCPGLNSPFRCIQERCTCRPIVDPLSMMAQQTLQMGQGPQMGGPQGKGQMGGPQGKGQMGGPQGKGQMIGGPQGKGQMIGGPQGTGQMMGGPQGKGQPMGGPQSKGQMMGPQGKGQMMGGPQGPMMGSPQGQMMMGGPSRGQMGVQNRTAPTAP